jgi:hypothetical protein
MNDMNLTVIEMNALCSVTGGRGVGSGPKVYSFDTTKYETLLGDPDFQRVTGPNLADVDSDPYFTLGAEAGAGAKKSDPSRMYDLGFRKRGPNGTLIGPVVDGFGQQIT